MSKTRRTLYKIARIMGDIEAVSKGKAGKRIQRRLVGKMTGKALKSSGCFIATASYGTPLAEEVKILTYLRDNYLEKYLAGRIFITLYYFFSPTVSKLVARYSLLKKIVRSMLHPLISFLSNLFRVEKI